MESSIVPPGFRFHPTDEELVGYYLRKKVASQKIDLDVIRDIDLYRIEPWDLIEKCRIGYEEQNEWYFFSHKDKKYPTGTRTNRATIAGFWKATGRDKAVYSKTKLIGMRKTLVFYKGRAPNGQKTDWIMHEYRLESDENGSPQEEGWVVCRAFKKKATTTTTNNGQHNKNNIEGWESSYFYDQEHNGSITSIVDPIHNDYLLSRQPQKFISQNFMYCKQEIEADALSSFMDSNNDQFVQLPQLESPSLPLIKRPPISISTVSKDEDEDQENFNDKNNAEKVTDWRALDKFVASQLSQEDRLFDEDQIGESSFTRRGGHKDCDDDMALLLLQRSRDEEEDKLNGFLNSSSHDHCDIGICLFEK